MMQLDYTFERQIELEREEATEEGWKRGLEQGLAQGLEQGLEQGTLDLIRKKIAKGKSMELIAEELEETPETIQPLYERVKNESM